VWCCCCCLVLWRETPSRSPHLGARLSLGFAPASVPIKHILPCSLPSARAPKRLFAVYAIAGSSFLSVMWRRDEGARMDLRWLSGTWQNKLSTYIRSRRRMGSLMSRTERGAKAPTCQKLDSQMQLMPDTHGPSGLAYPSTMGACDETCLKSPEPTNPILLFHSSVHHRPSRASPSHSPPYLAENFSSAGKALPLVLRVPPAAWPQLWMRIKRTATMHMQRA
jgi:hypothetical protein